MHPLHRPIHTPSCTIRVMYYRHIRCFEARGDKLPPENPAYRCPDRASSPEITATSPDVPAAGMARKTTHERYLGRHRSSQSEELTTNGASPQRGAHPKMANARVEYHRVRTCGPTLLLTLAVIVSRVHHLLRRGAPTGKVPEARLKPRYGFLATSRHGTWRTGYFSV